MTKKHNAPWTPRDLRTLKAAAKRGLSSTEASRRLGRSAGATRYKAMTAGVRFLSMGRAFSHKQRARWV